MEYCNRDNREYNLLFRRTFILSWESFQRLPLAPCKAWPFSLEKHFHRIKLHTISFTSGSRLTSTQKIVKWRVCSDKQQRRKWYKASVHDWSLPREVVAVSAPAQERWSTRPPGESLPFLHPGKGEQKATVKPRYSPTVIKSLKT